MEGNRQQTPRTQRQLGKSHASGLCCVCIPTDLFGISPFPTPFPLFSSTPSKFLPLVFRDAHLPVSSCPSDPPLLLVT